MRSIICPICGSEKRSDRTYCQPCFRNYTNNWYKKRREKRLTYVSKLTPEKELMFKLYKTKTMLNFNSFLPKVNDVTEEELLKHDWNNYKLKDLYKENPRFAPDIQKLMIEMNNHDCRKYNKKK